MLSLRRLSMSFAVLAIALSASAHATTGLLCTPIAGAGPKLSLIVGAEGVMGAALYERGRWLLTMDKDAPFTVMRGSINRKHARVDLVSRRANRTKVRLRVRMLPLHPRGISASGTLQRFGRTYRVNCVQD